MYSLAQLFQGISECNSIIDSVLNSLQSINKQNVTLGQINALIQQTSQVVDRLNNVVKLINGAVQTLPHYLSFLQGKQNQLQSSMNKVEITIVAYNVLNYKSFKRTKNFSHWEKARYDTKTNNTINVLKSELTSIRALLRMMERKLK